jgi:thioredoxin-related protein
MMKRQAIVVITLLVGVFVQAAAVAAAGTDPYKHFFNETWGDFKEELDNARQQQKKGILIFFEMDECPFCHYMKMNVLNQPEVQAFYRKNFLNFTVDIEGDVEITNMEGKVVKQKDFAFRENRVRATPVIAFFDLDGKRIFRHTGKTSGVEEFIWMGQYVVDGSYKETSFTRYKRNKRKEKKK